MTRQILNTMSQTKNFTSLCIYLYVYILTKRLQVHKIVLWLYLKYFDVIPLGFSNLVQVVVNRITTTWTRFTHSVKYFDFEANIIITAKSWMDQEKNAFYSLNRLTFFSLVHACATPQLCNTCVAKQCLWVPFWPILVQNYGQDRMTFLVSQARWQNGSIKNVVFLN